MPLYEYSCKNCGTQFEKMVGFSEADKLPECPACHSNDTRKKVSLFSSRGSSSGAGYSSAGSGCASSGPFT